MARLLFHARAHPVTDSTRLRHRFTLLAIAVTVVLIGWGGLVTSIDAGLAVPDWPSSFGSYDPIKTGYVDPLDASIQWWERLPILAEHGHRLIATLIGFFTVILAFWTGFRDDRRWMRQLGYVALALVIFQGILGGLRVVWLSLDLAVVHACMAQIFFSTLVAMALFTSKGWLEAQAVPVAGDETDRLRRLMWFTVGSLYVQIIMGALLRHPGSGTDPVFVTIHAAGAFVVVALVLAAAHQVRLSFRDNPLLNRAAFGMVVALTIQFILGFTALIILLVETRLARRSVFQIVLNSSHLVVGALLMASAVTLLLLLSRQRQTADPSTVSSTAVNTPSVGVGF